VPSFPGVRGTKDKRSLVAANGEFTFAPVKRGLKSTPPAARTYDDCGGEAQASESCCNRLTRMICLHEGKVIMELFRPPVHGVRRCPKSTCPKHGTKHPHGVHQASNDPLPQTGTEPPTRRPCHVPALRPLRRPVGEGASGTSQTHQTESRYLGACAFSGVSFPDGQLLRKDA